MKTDDEWQGQLLDARWRDEFNGYQPESEEEVVFLREYDASKFPIITVTVDNVVFHPDANGLLWVLLIKRGNWPFKGKWALPGGFVDKGETAYAAARRELDEEASIAVMDMRQVFVADHPDRDPRGHCISIVFAAKAHNKAAPFAGDDAVDAEWVPVRDILAPGVILAFDHQSIIRQAISESPGDWLVHS